MDGRITLADALTKLATGEILTILRAAMSGIFPGDSVSGLGAGSENPVVMAFRALETLSNLPGCCLPKRIHRTIHSRFWRLRPTYLLSSCSSRAAMAADGSSGENMLRRGRNESVVKRMFHRFEQNSSTCCITQTRRRLRE